MKADLYTYGGRISFDNMFRFLQGDLFKGYPSILQSIIHQAQKKDLDIIGIASLDVKTQIPIGKQDRFAYLVNESRTLPKDYTHDKIGKNILEIENKGKILYLVNAQGICTLDEKRIRRDFIAIGNNKIPYPIKLEDALKRCQDDGLVVLSKQHLGHLVGLEEKVVEFKDYFDGLSYSTEAPRKRAEKIIQHSKEIGLPVVVVSGAHTFGNIGRGYIEIPDDAINLFNNEKFLESLRTIIKNKNYKNQGKFATPLQNAGWKIPLGLYSVGWEAGIKKLFGVNYKLKK
ncbi:MAG: PHP-associated domain-containing protein [Candidatus Pacearchaeota archaeon]